MFYVFHHIPKTAGTSCGTAFQKIFNVIYDIHENTDADTLARYSSNKVNLVSLDCNNLLWGHYNIPGHYLYQRYPRLDEYEARKIVFLREPMETAVSGVKFGLANGWFAPDRSDKMLVNRVGYFSKMLQCNHANYMEILDTYYFVGIKDTLQDSFDAFSAMSGKTSTALGRLNSTDQVVDPPFSKDAVDFFNKNNQLDTLIYQYARKRAWDLINSVNVTTASGFVS